MKKFTFKTEKGTGRYRAFYSDTHYIKLGGLECGEINDSSPHKIRFMVYKTKEEADKSNCKWKWITLKKESSSLLEAKEFIKANNDYIQSKFNIHTHQ